MLRTIARKATSAPKKPASSAATRRSGRRSVHARLGSSATRRETRAPIDALSAAHPTIEVHLAIGSRVPRTGLIAQVLPALPRPQAVLTRRTIPDLQNVREIAARLLVGIFVLLGSSLACAQAQDAQQWFAQGQAAFQRQGYARALEAFEAALAARMEGPAVHFNIGVAAYRAGAYDKARAAFERVALTPSMASLAHYNLGLVALAQNDEQRAIDLFVRVLGEGEDERLRALARAQLERIGTEPGPERAVWAMYASTAVGYDDNVTLTSSGQAVGFAREGDAYGDVLLAGSMQLSDAWRLDADASLLKYAELGEFDQSGIGGGARYRFALTSWTLDLGGRVGTSYLDRERLDVRESVYLQAVRSLTQDLALRARYRVTNVDGNDDYPGYDGVNHEVLVRATRRIRLWTAGVAYVFEVNDYDSAALSTVRHRVSADVRVPLSRRWAVRSSLSYRHGDYDDPDIGTEHRIEFGATAEMLLNERWTLALRYTFTDNDAATPAFSYRANRVALGVDVAF